MVYLNKIFKYRKKTLILIVVVLIFINAVLLHGSYKYYKIKAEKFLLNSIKLFVPVELRNKFTNNVYKTPIFIKTNLNDRKIYADCELYNNNYTQFYVNINEVKYPSYIPLYYDKRINFDCLNKIKKRNRILLWNKFCNIDDYEYGLGYGTPFADHNCPVTNCELTNDRKMLNESDFVVIHAPDDLDHLPQYKFDFQRWVLMVFESPLNTFDFSHLDGLFELSSTYKFTSNTSSYYYSLAPHLWTSENKEFNENKDFSYGKNNFVAILVSNCDDHMHRLDYIHNLNKHIPVSVYGKCGKPCPFENRDACKAYIVKNYKFYFAIENSYCEDYITEKFFDTLRYDIIPVVLGGGNYEKFIPKNGFINALDFKTPKMLAKYLLKVSSNKTLYNSFFKWKKYVHIPDKNPRAHMCDLCILLNLNNFQQSNSHDVLSDLHEFWNSEKDCRLPIKKWNSVINYVNFKKRK